MAQNLGSWPVIVLPHVFVPCELTFLSKLWNIFNSSVGLKNINGVNGRVYSQFNVFLIIGLSGIQNEVLQTNQVFFNQVQNLRCKIYS